MYRGFHAEGSRSVCDNVFNTSLVISDDSYHRYPGWIQAIWIRVVEGVDPQAEQSLNAESRFEKAFAGIPPNVWTIFKDPAELLSSPI